LIATQVVGVSLFYFEEVQSAKQLKPNFAEYEYTLNHFFDHSQDKDVYIFVLDTLSSTLFDEISAEIPYHELFKDFTYFPRHFVYYPAATKWSIPRILSGIDVQDDSTIGTDHHNSPENEAFFHAVFSQKTLFDDVTENGYECRAYTWAPGMFFWNPQSIKNIKKLENSTIEIQNLFDPHSLLRMNRLTGLTIYRLLPLILKRFSQHRLLAEGLLTDEKLKEDIFINNEYAPLFLASEDILFFRKIQSIPWDFVPQRKQFKFIHLQAAHYPYIMDENAEPLARSIAQDEPQLQRRQANGTLKIVGAILERLKEVGGYDNSLIVITADHGQFDLSSMRTDPTAKNKPLLLVKRPRDNYNTLQFNDNPVCLSDARNAVLVELDLPRPDGAFSWFNVPQELAEKRNAEWSVYLNYLNEREKRKKE
jgi:hypothetical protein